MKIHLNKKLIFALVLVLPVLFATYVSAETANIEFPIAELGNCASKEECRTYCDMEENFSACREFASGKNLSEDGQEGEKFSVIKEDGGPGNCAKGAKNPMSACESFCNDVSNIRECVLYAKEHDLMNGEDLEEAEKVMAALDRGVKLPSGCANKESCERACSEPKNMTVARECFDFAEAAGLLPPGVSREQAEKVFKAIEEGRAPFKSPKDFEQCENPGSEEIMEKCVNFAIENGFLSEKEAEIVKKTGGKGPGGCRGKKECEAYCEANQEECFAFAEKHNLISEEDKARMKEGMSKLRESLEMSPAEVRECIQNAIGADNLEKILEGRNRPTEEFGEKMRQCFEKMMKGQDLNRPEKEFEGQERSFERPPGMGEEWNGRPGEGRMPEGDFRGQFNGERPEGFPSEEEMRRMYEERMRQAQSGEGEQYPRPPDEGEGFPAGMPSEGEMPYPREGGYPPPEYSGPPEGSFSPPPEDSGTTLPPPESTYLLPPPESSTPPPPTEEAPTSLMPKVQSENLLSSVANLLYLLFR